MQVAELHTRFLDARERRDWSAVLSIGGTLVANRQYGDPRGIVASRTAAAAARLGRLYEAITFVDIARQVVEPSSLLDAAVLCDAAYYYRKHGAANRALEAGALYLQRHPSFPTQGQDLLALVLHHMGASHFSLRNWPAAVEQFIRSAEVAKAVGQVALMGMALADLAEAYLELNTAAGTAAAAEALDRVPVAELHPRGLFAYQAVNARYLERTGRRREAVDAALKALSTADDLDEPLDHERAMINFMLAKCSDSKATALLLALEAAAGFERFNDLPRLRACEEFLRHQLDRFQCGA